MASSTFKQKQHLQYLIQFKLYIVLLMPHLAYLINDQSSMESVSNYYIFLDVLKVAEKLRYLSCDTVTYVITDIGLFTTTSFDDKLRPNQPCSKWHSVVQFWRITMNPHTVFDGRGWQQRFSQTNVSLREFILLHTVMFIFIRLVSYLKKKKVVEKVFKYCI